MLHFQYRFKLLIKKQQNSQGIKPLLRAKSKLALKAYKSFFRVVRIISVTILTRKVRNRTILKTKSNSRNVSTQKIKRKTNY